MNAFGFLAILFLFLTGVCFGIAATLSFAGVQQGRSIWIINSRSPEKYLAGPSHDSDLALWEHLETRPASSRMPDYVHFVEVLK